MGRLFPMDHRPLLGLLIVSTFALAVLADVVLGTPRIMVGIFLTGYFLVLVVTVLGDSLPIVADSDGPSIWRRTGREFSKGRNLVDDEQVDPVPTDPVEELRTAYVYDEIDESEFERRLEGLLTERVIDTEAGEGERYLDSE